jgi:linoleoyl-CoA desaturase
MSAAKVSFDNGGDFMRDTRREVDEYLDSGRARQRGRMQLYAKAFVAFSLLLASWISIVFVRPGLALGLVSLAGITVGTILIGFCVQHDANHGAYFRTRRANHLMGWTADTMLGISSYAWRVKHNVAHHTYTNVDGYDDDINQTPFLRLNPSQEPRKWYRLQHLYVWPLYCVMVIRWQIGADAAAIIRGRIATSALHTPRRWDLAGLLVGKAVFLTWAIVVPLFFYPWWVVACGYLAFAAVTSLITATTFQLAHCVEEAEFTSPEKLEASKRVWAVHEVETTVDFCPRNHVMTWMLGGLNYQIEHHLFPRVSHVHYPHIAEIVKRNAALHGVRYNVHPSLWSALRSHQRHVRALGRIGMPVEIEMG